jgi:hypothetical protein
MTSVFASPATEPGLRTKSTIRKGRVPDEEGAVAAMVTPDLPVQLSLFPAPDRHSCRHGRRDSARRLYFKDSRDRPDIGPRRRAELDDRKAGQ